MGFRSPQGIPRCRFASFISDSLADFSVQHMMVPGMETCVRGGNGAADFVPFCWVHILYYRDICQSSLINYLRHPEQPIQWRGHPDLKNKHEPYAISFVRTLFAEAPKLETEFKKHMRFGLVDSPARTVDVGPMSIEDIKTLFYNVFGSLSFRLPLLMNTSSKFGQSFPVPTATKVSHGRTNTRSLSIRMLGSF